MTVTHLDETLRACTAGGYMVPGPRMTARPGLVMGIVEGPDANWVEFIETTA